jgi:nitrogen regulatory protein PII
MKIPTLIDLTKSQQELSGLLRSMEQVPGSTFNHVMGQGNEAEGDTFVSARNAVVGYIPRIRFGLQPKDDDVEVLLTGIIDEQNNITGQDVYWVTPVEKGGNIL